MEQKEIKNRPIGIDDREKDFLGVPAGGGGCCLIIWFSAIIGVIIYFKYFFNFGWFDWFWLVIHNIKNDEKHLRLRLEQMEHHHEPPDDSMPDPDAEMLHPFEGLE